jgi:hypothetical protein
LKNTVTDAIIKPNSDSVLFAVMEKGGVPIVPGVTQFVDLTAPSGATAWPLAGFGYLVVRSQEFRQTCANK